VNPLAVPPGELAARARFALDILADAAAVTARFVDDLDALFRAAKAEGRAKVAFILPVGPVGQFEAWAERCNRARLSLRDLVAINMDEYLTADGRDFIPESDPLSFRRHMREKFWSRLDPELAPPPEQRVFPDPRRPGEVPELIDRLGGVDVCFGGVGITGHLAFNDPPEPGEPVVDSAFAALPTRVVELSRETRTINAFTAAKGNLDRIPRLAVTVGMKEILAAKRVRIYMNRPWQCAIVRKLACGPRSAAVPASLLQGHPDIRLAITQEVAQLPEPELR